MFFKIFFTISPSQKVAGPPSSLTVVNYPKGWGTKLTEPNSSKMLEMAVSCRKKDKVENPIRIEWGFLLKDITMVQIKEKVRTVAFLSRQQLDFLDKLGKDALFYQGCKLSRAQILSELVNLLMELKINIKQIDVSQGGMAKGILKVLNNHRQPKTENGQNTAL